MLRNRISSLLAFICTFLVTTSLTALTPAEELYEKAWQSRGRLSQAERLNLIFSVLKIEFEFPKSGGILSVQCSASAQSESAPNTFLLRFKDSLVNTLTTLQERDGSVGVDSLLFAQIAAILLDGKGSDPTFQLLKGTPSQLDLTFVSERKFRHIVPEHDDAKRFISSNKYPNFRSLEVWLLDVGDETFAGMSRSGPLNQPLEDWVATICDDVALECKERLSGDDTLRALALEGLIKVGRFERWKVEL